jgi:hypothetical protein
MDNSKNSKLICTPAIPTSKKCIKEIEQCSNLGFIFSLSVNDESPFD